MSALHSVQAPLSAERGLTSSTDVMQPKGLSFPHGDGFLFSTSYEPRSNKTIHDGEILALKKLQSDHNIQGPWVGRYGDSPVEAFRHGHVGTEAGGVDIHLREEDSLVSVGDSLNPVNHVLFKNEHKPLEVLPEKNMEILNVLAAILRGGERSRTHVSDARLQKGTLEMGDSNNLYHHLQSRPSSQFPLQTEQARPLFPSVDHVAHKKQHMTFAGSNFMHLDPQHTFLENSVPCNNLSTVCASRFDPAAAHPPMFQHMPVSGSSHHPMQGLPRGGSLSYPINHIPGLIPETNNMHNFSLHSRHSNYGGGHDTGLPGSTVGGGGATHMEDFGRLLRMEMQAYSKKFHSPRGPN